MITEVIIQDLGSVELVGVQYTVHFLACTDAVGIIIPFRIRYVNTSAHISCAGILLYARLLVVF